MVKEGRVLKSEVDINSITFLNGDTVCIPANIIHFHGSLNGEGLSHIAIMKMYKLNRDEKSMLKRSVTKCEYDLLREEKQNENKNAERSIDTAEGNPKRNSDGHFKETNKPRFAYVLQQVIRINRR